MDLVRDEDLTEDDARQLSFLYDACFGGMRFSESPRSTLRCIWRNAGAILAHAAASVRQVDLHTELADVAVLGFVCVHPGHRGRHLGREVVNDLHGALDMPFLLNGGKSLVPYYAKLGYVAIASEASYLHGGVIEMDRDPVMLFPNGRPVSLEMRSDPIHFGPDF
ncbi:MAG: GNAT family N-acetyltransferase [bacterium]|nr:GNAT family N-acetyltransferase [bacterium]